MVKSYSGGWMGGMRQYLQIPSTLSIRKSVMANAAPYSVKEMLRTQKLQKFPTTFQSIPHLQLLHSFILKHSFAGYPRPAREHSTHCSESSHKRMTLEETLCCCSALLCSHLQSPQEAKDTLVTPEKLIQYLKSILVAANEEHNVTFLEDKRFLHLVDKLSKRLVSFTAAQLYTLLTLFAKIQHCPSSLLIQIFTEFSEGDVENALLNDLTHAQFSNLILILSHLTVPNDTKEKFEAFLSAGCEHIAHRLSLPVPAHEMDDDLSSEPLPYSNDSILSQTVPLLSLKECLSIVLGFSNIGYRNFRMLHELADYILAHHISLDLHSKNYEWLDKSIEDVIIIGPQLSTLFLSFSTLGLKHPQFYQALAYQLANYVPKLAPLHLANIMIAFATLSNDPEFPLLLFLLKELENALLNKWSLFNGSDALAVCWAICCVEMYKSQPILFSNLLKRVCEERNTFNYEQLNQLHQVSLTIRLDDSDYMRRIKEELKSANLLNIIFQMDGVVGEQFSSKPDDYFSYRVYQELNTLLREPQNLSLVIEAAIGKVLLDAEAASIERDLAIDGFYCAPVGVTIPAFSVENPHFVHLKLIKICIDIKSGEFPDFDEPVDPYILLKHRHLRKMGWIVVYLDQEEFLSLLNTNDAQLGYLCQQFRKAFAQNLPNA